MDASLLEQIGIKPGIDYYGINNVIGFGDPPLPRNFSFSEPHNSVVADYSPIGTISDSIVHNYSVMLEICELCGQGFSVRGRKNNLSRHMKTIHAPGADIHKCHLESCKYNGDKRADNRDKHERRVHQYDRHRL